MTKSKLHSIHVLQDGKDFAGRLKAGASAPAFRFSPETASIEGGRLVLTGTVSVGGARGSARKAANVKATCLGLQGSIQNAPARPRLVSGSLRHPLPDQPADRPATDATGSLSSAGAIYFRLSPLDGAALGVDLDLGSVQMNARLNPSSDAERALHWLYSAATAAASPADYVSEINRIYRG